MMRTRVRLAATCCQPRAVRAGLSLLFAALAIISHSPAAAPGAAAATTHPAGSPVLELVEALLASRGYLFDESGQAALDEINRQIRESRGRPGPTAAGRPAAEQRLFELLERCGRRLDVKWVGGRAVLETSAPLALPGDGGAILLHIAGARPGGLYCLRVDYDLAQSRASIPLDVASEGATWAVVRLANAPAGVSTLVFELKRPGEPAGQLALPIKAPEPAQLSIRIISAVTGRPVPAMVELVWKTDNQGRRPPNAVDFSAQFDNLGRPTAQRHANLPGRWAGHFWWCVPGPFDMPVPPGRWQIAIRHGLEYVPVLDTFETHSGQALEKTYRLRQWADMPFSGWYSGDDHVHCRLTSDADAQRLLAWAQAEDVHLVNVLKAGDVYRTWFQQRGFGPAFRVLEGDYAIVPGQECPRTHSDGFGHTISLNLTAGVRDVNRYWLYDWAADSVHAQGGLFGFAHASIDHPYTRRGMSLIATRPRVDFAEILQAGQMGTGFYYEFLNLGYKLTATAGTDVPWHGTIGEVRTYAFIGKGPFSADAWFDAVKRGRTFVTNGPMLDLRVDEAMPGEQITVRERGSSPRNLRVQARAWGDPEVMVPTKLEIIRHGEVIREVESSDPQNRELALDFELPAGNGYWLAARAVGSDGSLAHSTPVYVVREPLRFWKIEAVDELIAKRMANLDDVEQLIARARARVEKGDANGDMTARTMAAQADELHQRVAEARSFYRDLLKLAQQERSMR